MTSTLDRIGATSAGYGGERAGWGAGINSDEALLQRMNAGTLTWRGPALMLFARTVFGVGAQAVVAGVFLLRSSPTPWHAAEPWLPVYATLIDIGCLALMWRLTSREGIRLFDLVGFERRRLARDVLLGLAIVPGELAVILGGVYAAGWLLYGTLTQPLLFESLPGPATLYAALVFPVLWGLTEQMTYNGYLLPRLKVLFGSTSLAVACVSFVWALEHVFLPLTFDPTIYGLSIVGSATERDLPNAAVSATSPVGSPGYCARAAGWFHRVDRCHFFTARCVTRKCVRRSKRTGFSWSRACRGRRRAQQIAYGLGR